MNSLNVANNLGLLASKRELEAANPQLSPAERDYVLWIARQYRDAQAEVLAKVKHRLHIVGH